MDRGLLRGTVFYSVWGSTQGFTINVFAEGRSVSHSWVPCVFSFPSLVLLLLSTSQFEAMSTSNIFSCLFHHVLSGFLWTAWFNRLEASWWQCCQQHNCLFLSLPEEKRVQQLSVSHLFTCRNIQTLLCVYLKASNEGNMSCNAARDIETCEETFFWFFGSRFQEEPISWML